MLSVVVCAPELSPGFSGAALARPEAVARTLAALVPLTVESLVRDVSLATLEKSGLRDLADYAGCHVFENASPGRSLAMAIASARSELVWVLLAGRAPDAGFAQEVADHFDCAEPQAPRSARLLALPDSLLTRLLPSFSEVASLIVRKRDVGVADIGFRALVNSLQAPVTFKTRLRRVA